MPARRPKGLDSPLTRRLIKYMSTVNIRLYRATDGRIGGKWRVGSAFPRGLPICLLTTTGRKSGQRRVSPLLFMRDGARIVLVASQGGQPKNPGWYWNIRSNPGVELQIRTRKQQMRARVADPDERAALWPKLVAMYADFADYQSWTDREIPVVICE